MNEKMYTYDAETITSHVVILDPKSLYFIKIQTISFSIRKVSGRARNLHRTNSFPVRVIKSSLHEPAIYWTALAYLKRLFILYIFQKIKRMLLWKLGLIYELLRPVSTKTSTKITFEFSKRIKESS